MAVAFTLPGGIPVYAFSLAIGLGASLGLAWIAWGSPPKQAIQRLEAGLLALGGALLGGRAAFVAVNWGYYQSHLAEIPAVFQGGLSWPGTLAGGLLAVVLLASFTRLPFGEYALVILPLLATLTVSAWLGCWLDGCAYGPLADKWWGMPARDEWGLTTSRWPVQMLGALLGLLMFGLLDLALRWQIVSGGALVGLAVLGLSLELQALSTLRADPSQMWRGLRLETWAATAFALAAVVVLLASYVYRLIKLRGEGKGDKE